MARRRTADPIAEAFNPPVALEQPLDITRVPAKAALEIAEGAQTPHQVLSRMGFDDSQIDWLMQYEPFLQQVDRFRLELEKNGYTFKAKSAMLAEHHLDTTNKLIVDQDTPPHVKLDAIKWLARMAGLEPKEGVAGSAGVSISINLGAPGDAAAKPIVIDSVPTGPLISVPSR